MSLGQINSTESETEESEIAFIVGMAFQMYCFFKFSFHIKIW